MLFCHCRNRTPLCAHVDIIDYHCGISTVATVGRCPVCRKVCFYRSVLPATGWERTLEHMMYWCCYGFVQSLHNGKCPVRGCDFAVHSKNRWQLVAHLDEASTVDVAHKQHLQSVAVSATGKARIIKVSGLVGDWRCVKGCCARSSAMPLSVHSRVC